MSGPDGRTRPVALVTGANKGIGLATARSLAAQGASVLIGARDAGRGAAAVAELVAQGADARLVQLDVTDPQSVKSAAALVDRCFGRLDVLINNAGVLLEQGCPVTEVSLEQLRRTFETNVFGAAEMIVAMLDLLRRSGSGRIVNVSSRLGSLSTNTEQRERMAPYQLLAYGSSKAALNALTVFYAGALQADGVAVNSIEPGFVDTDLNGHTGTGRVEDAGELIAGLALHSPASVTGTFRSAAGPVPW